MRKYKNNSKKYRLSDKMGKERAKKHIYISLQDAADKYCNYSQEYLSLRAR